MKKTLSYVLMFSLCFFSFFSTGCRSGGSGFKFLGAIVTGSIIAASGGSAAAFAANLRGASADVKIGATDVELNIHELDNGVASLKGATVISKKTVTLSEGKLNFKLSDDERLEVGEYLFVVNHKGADKPFLRAILSVFGNSNELALEISPITEVKTIVYENWINSAENKSYANFEENVKRNKTSETEILTKADEYLEDLIVWSAKPDADKKTEDVSDVDVTAIDVPAEDLAKEPTKSEPVDTEFAKKVPSALKNYTWKDVTAEDLNDSYDLVYQKYNGNWIEIKNPTPTTTTQDYYLTLPRLSIHGEDADGFEGSADLHGFTTEFFTWLMGRATNGVVTLPKESDPKVLEYIGEGEEWFKVYSSTFSDNVKVNNSVITIITAETASTIKFEAKMAINGKKKYLYVKNQNNNKFAEKIYVTRNWDDDE